MSQQSSRTIVINADETPRENIENNSETVADTESADAPDTSASNVAEPRNQVDVGTPNQSSTSNNGSTQANTNQGVPNSIARQNSTVQSNGTPPGGVESNRLTYAPQRRFRREGVNAQSNNVPSSSEQSGTDNSQQNSGNSLNDSDRGGETESHVTIQQFPNLTRPVPSEELRSPRSQQSSRPGATPNNRPLLSRRSSRPNLLQRSISTDSSGLSNTVRQLPDRNRTLSNSRAPVSRRNSNTSTGSTVSSGAQASNPAARARRRSEIMQDAKTKRQNNAR